jgi:tRNA pseudouridine13 synthase
MLTSFLIEPEKLEEDEAKMSSKKSRKTRRPAQVKVLTEKDLKKYSIFDVLMPLPGHDVAYPGGELGEMYREFLKMDGLDPDNWVRKQKWVISLWQPSLFAYRVIRREFSLGGSYRKIMHLPRNVSWRILRYTDPDVALAQADEDKLLGFDPPVVDENGKFVALQIELQLGTAAYATMALREVTKTETSSHFQINLTQASEDQKYRSGFVPTE